jgi:hypothetical protein
MDSNCNTGTVCPRQDLCHNGGTCYLNINDQPFCVCTSGFSGEQCDFIAKQVDTSQSSASSNIALIVGLSVGGAILLLVVGGLIFYCFIYPRMRGRPMKYERAASDISSGDDQHLAKFDQNSVRIDKFWPKSPPRYTPQTYSAQDEPAV